MEEADSGSAPLLSKTSDRVLMNPTANKKSETVW